MHNLFKKLRSIAWYYTTLIAFVAILLVGFFLRFDRFTTIPRHGATFDEFAWVWLGVNLIQNQEPISWSSHPFYKNRYHLVYQGAKFWIVKPYLEHPPLFGLVSGGFALMNGTANMYDVTLAKIRPLALALGVFSIVAIFLFTRQIYGNLIAIFSSLLYSLVPTIVIGSRIVQNENFLIPFWLLSLYALYLYLRTNSWFYLFLSSVIAGLLSLAKVPWLVAGLSIVLILSYKKKWQEAIFVGIITVLFFSLFIVYGFYQDKELFLNLWRLQIARYDISFAGFFSVFTNPLLIDRYYLDGWILFGWLSIFFLAKDFKKHFFVLIPFVVYLFVYIFVIPNEPSHGWYRYPFYPFLLISIAIFLKEELENISARSLIFILVVGLALFFNTYERAFGFSYLTYRSFVFLSFLSVFLPFWFDRENKWSRSVLIFWLVFFFVLSVFSVTSYIE